MKRFFVIILLSLFTITYICGQEIKKHVVQRGETLESIAKNYNISPTNYAMPTMTWKYSIQG